MQDFPDVIFLLSCLIILERWFSDLVGSLAKVHVNKDLQARDRVTRLMSKTVDGPVMDAWHNV